MLILKPNCERCDSNLSPSQPDAMICSSECTFCKPCAEESLLNRCPNCGGELVPRPTRADHHLIKHPGSDIRVNKDHLSLNSTHKQCYAEST